jgi:hypothetical protein
MNRKQVNSTEQTGRTRTDGAWGLRQSSLLTGEGARTRLNRSTGISGLKRTRLELELSRDQRLTAVTNLSPSSAMARQGLALKICLLEKGQGPRRYEGRYIFSATDTATRSTCTN